MTDRTGATARSRKAHRAAGSRKAVAALSAAATAGLMFAMATVEPAWTAQAAIQSAPDAPRPAVAAPAARSQILLPIPPAGDGSMVTPTVAPATPQPVQLDPVAPAPTIVTKTVVVKRATARSNGSR